MTDATDPAGRLARNLATRFQARRLSCAYSVDTLARLSGVAPARIRAIESGTEAIDPRVIETVGAVLGLSPRELSAHDAPDRAPEVPLEH
ncbi:helix-turn-helix domain-containing protein [Methylobacterium nigriterrae]|uniref:helix-turn-helix domain-containing protein n=1 Tax=Methylobacterium nigriterrae TaxID=3127512 RepID=UPI003013FC0E